MVPVLRFRLFGMPVTVRGSFLLIAAVIGFIGAGNPQRTIAIIAVIFVSILIHELGHAVAARMFGSEVSIELNGLGGLTRWTVPERDLTPGRRAFIAAAGSATGLLFGGAVWLVAWQVGPFTGLTSFVVSYLIIVNVFWGLLNWLPIRPLDGGHLLESLLEKVAPKRGDLIAKVVFTGTAAAVLLISIQLRLIFIAVLAGWLLLSEFSMNRQPSAQPSTGLPTLSYDDPSDDDPSDAAPPLPPRIIDLGDPNAPRDEPTEPDR